MGFQLKCSLLQRTQNPCVSRYVLLRQQTNDYGLNSIYIEEALTPNVEARMEQRHIVITSCMYACDTCYNHENNENYL